MKKKYLYQHYTWPELGEAVARQPVVLLPIGSVEDHGHHLPLDVDNFLIWNICEKAAEKAENDILLMPLIPYGFEAHHMDFPGTINVGIEHLYHFVLDITRSLAHHGFQRILIADGHGSNMPILDLVARQTIVETGVSCAAFIWPALAAEVIKSLRESPIPGGMSHACELETSVYLYLDPDRVQMEKARCDMGQPPSSFIWLDLMQGSPVRYMDIWSAFSNSGTNGDPTLANKDKGEKIFNAAVDRLIELVHEFKSRSRKKPVDHHHYEADVSTRMSESVRNDDSE
jgi:creatinine amidohydrolase